MKSMKMKLIKKIGLHPASPRCLKVYCLNLTMQHIGKDIARLVDNMTPEQRDQFNARFNKGRMEA